MKKYLKITIVLFSICLVCALAVAGVNTFTAPKIEEYQNQLKMEAYQGLFPNMDAATTTFTNEGFKSSYVKEKAVVKDASGQDLGLGFQVSGSNSYGSITLVVALDTEGNLLGLSCTENTQTGGRNTMINEYLTQFTSGMTAEEVADHPVYSGATFGSNLVKNLLAAAFSEAGIMSEIQETLVGIFGDNVDMAKTIEKTSLIYAQQVETGYTVKDAAGTVLGYYYVVNMSNRFGNINVAVSLNPDFTVKQIDQIDVTQRPYGQDPNKTDTTQIAKDFISGIQAGSSYDDVNGLATVSKATISTTSAKAAILVAIKEAQNTFDENLALRIMFYNYGNVTEVTEGKLDTVDKYQSVVDSENKEIGQVVSVVSDSINLYVGIDSNDKLAGIFVVAGNSDSITSAVKAIEIGSDGTTAVTAAGTNIRELVATAFEQVTGVRPKPGYDSDYATLFEGVDTSKSQDYDISSLDAQFDEGKSLYDANGTLLGYGFVLTSTANEFDGTLTIMVGVQVSGKLQKVIMLSNDQTDGYGSLIEGYEDKFTEGMSASDVNAVANATPNNLGSGQMKSLIVLALKAIAAYDDYYIEVFGEGISTTDIEVNRDEILQGVKVTKDGTDLGYAYIIRLENSYGYNVMCVALNANGTFKKLLDVENNHANLTDIATVFEDGSNMEQIIAQGNSDKAIEIGASYTSEIATLGIKIAMDACSGNLTESVSDEIYIKTLFNYAVMRRCKELETITNSPITKAYKVVGVSNKIPGQDLGYVYFLTVENEDILMSLVVGVDINHNYVGAVMTDYVTKVSLNVNGSFTDTLQGKVTSYLAELVGMSDIEIKNAPYYETASYASQLVKYALRLCIAESNSVAMARPNLYSDSQIYLNAIEGLDLLTAKRLDNFIYPETISGIELSNGNKAFIIDRMDVYSHNYILVYIDKDGKLISIYDVENNHGTISGVQNVFTSGMTLEEVNDVDYNPTNDATAHSTYTIQMAKSAILIAMGEASQTKDNNVYYEEQVKNVFPFAVANRSIVVDSTAENVVFAYKAIGVSNFVASSFLGYYIVVSAENTFGSITLGVGLDYDNNLVGVYLISSPDYDTIADYIAKNYKVGLDLAGLNKVADLTNNLEASALIKELIGNAFAAYDTIHNPIDKYIVGINALLGIVDGKVNKIDMAGLETLPITNSSIKAAVIVKNTNGATLGNAYAVVVENNDILIDLLIIVDENGKVFGSQLMAYETKVSLDVNGSFSDTLQAKVSAYLTSFNGKGIGEIDKVADLADAYYASQLVKYAFNLVLAEYNNETLVQPNLYSDEAIYKAAIKNLDFSTVTRLNNFLYPETVSGIQLADGSKAFIVSVINGYSHNYVLVYLDKDNKLISIFDVENNHASISNAQPFFTTGMTASDVNNVKYDVTSDASFTMETTKLAIQIAMGEATKQVNNDVYYESIAKQIFPLIVVGRSQKLEGLPENVVYGYHVYGVLGYATGQELGYFFVVQKDDVTLGVGLDTAGKLVKVVVIAASDLNGANAYVVNFTSGMSSSDVQAVAGSETYQTTIKNNIKIAFDTYTSLTSTEGGSN